MHGLNVKRAAVVTSLFWLLVAPIVHTTASAWYSEIQARDVLLSCLKKASENSYNNQCYNIYNGLVNEATPLQTMIIGHAIVVAFAWLAGSLLYFGVRWVRAGNGPSRQS